jgi:hypothetical protein
MLPGPDVTSKMAHVAGCRCALGACSRNHTVYGFHEHPCCRPWDALAATCGYGHTHVWVAPHQVLAWIAGEIVERVPGRFLSRWCFTIFRFCILWLLHFLSLRQVEKWLQPLRVQHFVSLTNFTLNRSHLRGDSGLGIEESGTFEMCAEKWK